MGRSNSATLKYDKWIKTLTCVFRLHNLPTFGQSTFQKKMQRDCCVPNPVRKVSTSPPSFSPSSPSSSPPSFPSSLPPSLMQDWIYQQVLSVGEPLHPILPPLLQEFVTSILLAGISGRTASGYHSGHSNSHGQCGI